MNFPGNLKYVKSHEQIGALEDGTVLMGVSDYAQDAFRDLVFVSPPKVGGGVVEGKSFADVEPVKAVSGVYSSVGSVMVEVSEVLLDAPESTNEAPYEV